MLLKALFYLFALGTPVAEANAEAAAAVGLDSEDCAAPLWEQPYDCPARIEAALRVISDRESPGNFADDYTWVGRHRDDSYLDHRVWARAQRRPSYAMADWCPWVDDPTGASTVGPHGLMVRYYSRWLRLPGNCIPWWAMTVPRISATAAARYYVHACGDAGDVYRADLANGWCPRIENQQRAWRRRKALRRPTTMLDLVRNRTIAGFSSAS